MAYKNSALWQNSLGKPSTSEDENALTKLRASFDKFRQNVKHFAAQIEQANPDFTDHSITHIDSLWEIASELCGSSYEINPMEGYILGGAFLIHDLVMSPNAYPGGLVAIKKERFWDDAFLEAQQKAPTDASTKELENLASNSVLRRIHATAAQSVATHNYRDFFKDQDFFLIEDAELRDTLGETIGRIAASHHWDIENVFSKLQFKTGGAALTGFPTIWKVNEVKIACILRLADACHIDKRRAPTLKMRDTKFNEVSRIHWLFQSKINKPTIDNGALVYTSNQQFTKDEQSAWWLCYDTLKMIDNELSRIDSKLVDSGFSHLRFQANRIANLSNTRLLSESIRVKEWEPVDAKIHVEDVASLVKNLGGKALYGDNPKAALRELIQNSLDAIYAKRELIQQNDFGKISVELSIIDGKKYISVRDNGIGMDSFVISKYLFNFGKSYWKSADLMSQWPGLFSKKINHTGKYGIGFYSVLMIGDRIKIKTLRKGLAESQTLLVEMDSTNVIRPILKTAEYSECRHESGTEIVIEVTDRKMLEYLNTQNLQRVFYSMVVGFAPAIDCDLEIITPTGNELIKSDYWKTCTNQEFAAFMSKLSFRSPSERDDYFELGALDGDISNLEDSGEEYYLAQLEDSHSQIKDYFDFVYEGDRKVGRLAFTKNMHRDTITFITVNGLTERTENDFIGILFGENNNAARNEATINNLMKPMKDWANKQVSLQPQLSNSLSFTREMVSWGAEIGNLPIAIVQGAKINYSQLVEHIKKFSSIIITGYYSSGSPFTDLYFENVIVANLDESMFIYDARFTSTSYRKYHYENSLSRFIAMAIAEAWDISEEITKEYIIYDFADEEVTIAHIQGRDIREYSKVINKEGLS